MIYFVLAGDPSAPDGCPVKIGLTNNIYSRLVKMQVDNHAPLCVIRLVEGGEAKERALHEAFKAHRIRAEWFRYCPDMLGDIGAVDLPIEGLKPEPGPYVPRTPEQRARMSQSKKAVYADEVRAADIKARQQATFQARKPDRLRREIASYEARRDGMPVESRGWIERDIERMKRRLSDLEGAYQIAA